MTRIHSFIMPVWVFQNPDDSVFIVSLTPQESNVIPSNVVISLGVMGLFHDTVEGLVAANKETNGSMEIFGIKRGLEGYLPDAKSQASAAMVTKIGANGVRTRVRVSNPRNVRRQREGGINFDPAMYSIQIKRDGNGIPLPMDQQPIARINVRGFRGVIESITPANLPVMLGLAQVPQQLAMSN